MAKSTKHRSLSAPAAGTYPEWWKINDIAQHFCVSPCTVRSWAELFNIPIKQLPGSARARAAHAPPLIAAIEAGYICVRPHKTQMQKRLAAQQFAAPTPSNLDEYEKNLRRARSMCDRWGIPYTIAEVTIS